MAEQNEGSDIMKHQVAPVSFTGPTLSLHDKASTNSGRLFTALQHQLIIFSLFFISAFNSVLLFTLAYGYSQNDTRDSLLWLFRVYFLFAKGNEFLQRSSKTVALGYGILGAVFTLFGFKLIFDTIRSSRKHQKSTSNPLAKCNATCIIITKTAAQVMYPFFFISQRWQTVWGVYGSHFEVRLVCEEIFEVASQTVAAYSSSQSISNVPLNITYAIVIFLNSTSSTFFRRIFNTSLVKQRIACLLTDLVLDFVWGTLLPIWMYIPIVKIYLDRANILEYIDSFANSTREVERVLILSWRYYLLSIIPFINSLLNVLEVRSALSRLLLMEKSPLDDQPRVIVRQKSRGIILRLLHAGLTLYGVGILAVSIAANGSIRQSVFYPAIDCMHRVHPWFSTREACLGRYINCTSNDVRGTVQELGPMLDTFDEDALADLFLVSCPSLEMPPQIRHFHRLMTIIIVDSDLVAWDADAALTDEYFHELRTLQLRYIRFQVSPVGLLGSASNPLVSTVEWIHLEGINASVILNQIGDTWRNVLFFDCVACGLTEFPRVLFHMPRVLMIYLSYNNIPSIPADWSTYADLKLQTLVLDNNPRLTEVPDSLWWQARTLGIFSFTDTRLKAIPEWVVDVAGPEFLVTAIRTPLCDAIDNLSDRLKPLVVCK